MINRTEAQEQAAVIQWAAYNESRYPCLKWLFHIANGGSRNKREAANLKKQGVKPGVSDLFLPWNNGQHCGLFIEMKRQGGRISEKQSEFISDMNKSGYKAVVCYGAEQAINALKKYLKPLDNSFDVEIIFKEEDEKEKSRQR